MPIRGRLRNSGGDPGTQGPTGNRGSRRVCGASGRVGSGQQPGNRQLSDRRAGLCDRARPLHLIHGGASSLCRHLLWRIRALAASACTPTASRRGAAPPGLRSEELATSDEGRRCPKGAPEVSPEYRPGLCQVRRPGGRGRGVRGAADQGAGPRARGLRPVQRRGISPLSPGAGSPRHRAPAPLSSAGCGQGCGRGSGTLLGAGDNCRCPVDGQRILELLA